MRRWFVGSAIALVAAISVLHAAAPAASRAPARAQATGTAVVTTSAAAQVSTPGTEGAPATADGIRPIVDRYCVTCHNDRLKTANLSLQNLDVSRIGERENAERLEKVIRKVRVRSMPPQGSPRPEPAAMDAFVESIETALDRAAAAHPNPGRKDTFHRLNRSEYTNAVRDIFALDVDVSALIPQDETSFGFDNIGGVLKISPTFMERYQTAAEKISRLAVGASASPLGEVMLRFTSDVNQDHYIEGLPLGTRGGTLIKHTFPVDGEYDIKAELLRGGRDDLPTFREEHLLEVSIDGESVKVFPYGNNAVAGRGQDQDPDADLPVDPDAPKDAVKRDPGFSVRVPVTAGPHELAFAFIKKTSALPLTTRDWFARPFAGATDTRFEPQLGAVSVVGPFNATGPGDTPSRQRIFTCRPASEADETRCGRRILTNLATLAYRRPVGEPDLRRLLEFFDAGRQGEGTFEAGIEAAISRILVSPSFLFRVERDPATIPASGNYRISNLELASRLSFFLWSSVPDQALLDAAIRGTLREPVVLKQQVRRMLADRRADALISNFAGQWLYLRNIPKANVEGFTFPDFEGGIRPLMKQETELFFGSILRDENAAVTELLSANHTFLNERLAKFYGIPNVYGERFRRVNVPDAVRPGGLLGQGSILLATSYSIRTAPTIRGKWILSTLLGVPPPDPPPNVPALPELVVGDMVQTATSVRQRLEKHRANPTCASCHRLMDPLGLALENFDAVGKWRTKAEGGSPIDASAVLFDGTKIENPVDLRQALLKYGDSFERTVTERLLTYALGRGVEYYDGPTIRKIVRDSKNPKTSFTSLILGIVNSMPFQMRRSES